MLFQDYLIKTKSMFSVALQHRLFNIMFIVICLLTGMQFRSVAQSQEIKGHIKGAKTEVAYLTMLYGGHQYAVDSARVTDGNFTFSTALMLQSGVYVVVLPPTSGFLILIDGSSPKFSFTADASDIIGSIQFQNSLENNEYYKYLNFFGQKKAQLDDIKKEFDAVGEDADRTSLIARMQAVKQDVITYQKDLVNRLPNSLTSAIIKCELVQETPAFTGSPEEINFKQYRFQKDHYFDNIDLGDERLIRTPKSVLVDRVDHYLKYIVPQQPDSIIQGIDMILAKSAASEVSFRFFLTHFFNTYRESQVMGMDAVYVHIAEKYIANGRAPWIEEKERSLVLDAVKRISPTVIGKVAPDFTVSKSDGTDLTLSAIESPFTVLIFWSPECTHCQEELPAIRAFYESYKDKGVEVLAICTKTEMNAKPCHTYLEKNQLTGWLEGSAQTSQAADQLVVYNIRTTPKILVLDKQKKILAKDFNASFLPEIMNRLLEVKKAR